MSTLKNLEKLLNEKNKGLQVSILSQDAISKEQDYFPTPSYDLNRILSGNLFKAIPSRTFSVIVGPEASFKSSFMALCAAKAQSAGYTPFILDAEGAWKTDFVSRWGIDPDNCLISHTPFVGDVEVILTKLYDSQEEKLFIIQDSIGSLMKRKVLVDGLSGDVKADQGTLQKEIKVMLKLMLAITKKQNCISMASGHFYGNPNSYGGAEEIGGGKFVRLAPDYVISLKKFPIYEFPNEKAAKRGKVLGNQIKAITLKNRYYPPYQEAIVDIDYRNGINKFAGMLDLAIEAGLISKGGAWYTVNKTGEKFQGEANIPIKEVFNDEMLNDLNEWLKTTGYSTTNTNVAEKEEEKEIEVPKE